MEVSKIMLLNALCSEQGIPDELKDMINQKYDVIRDEEIEEGLIEDDMARAILGRACVEILSKWESHYEDKPIDYRQYIDTTDLLKKYPTYKDYKNAYEEDVSDDELEWNETVQLLVWQTYLKYILTVPIYKKKLSMLTTNPDLVWLIYEEMDNKKTNKKYAKVLYKERKQRTLPNIPIRWRNNN